MFNSLIVDIHGMRTREAENRLKSIIEYVGNDIDRIVVIHGFHSGTALREMVRSELSHPRITAKRPTENEGETLIVIKKGRIAH